MPTVICPECSKQLAVSDMSRKFAICPYCGAQVKININVNYNFNYSKSEHTEHIVDEAKIKNAENVNRVIGVFTAPFEEHRRAQEAQEHRIQEEQERIRAEQRERKEKIMHGQYSFKEMLVDFMQSRQGKGVLCFALAILLSLVMMVWGAWMEENKAHQARLDALEQEKQYAAHLALNQGQIPEFDSSTDARTFVRDAKSHGFVNVTSEAVPDLVFGINNKEYEIIEVLVDGAPDYSPSTWYPLDTDIVVRYHARR